ncbi:MAG: GGDEF domain-containing protein [Gammaproteobacteria bacterium]|nr:GGDEF domain-containing protein [Gammaproteobacteria bacterium]
MANTAQTASSSTSDLNEKQEVARLLDKQTFTSNFPDALERLFRLNYAHRYRKRIRATLVFGLLLYLLTGLADLQLQTAVRNNLWLVRYALVAPVIVVSMLAAFWAKRDAALQLIYAAAILAAGTGSGVIMFLHPQLAARNYSTSLIVILFYCYVVSSMRVAYALPCALLVTGLYLAGAFLNQLSTATFGNLALLLAVVNLVALYACYRMEKEARRSFLHGRMVRLLSDEIVELAGVDELTGLANRRHLDDFYANTWARAQRDKVELTMMLVDVDYLQHLNQHLGRNIGDICLRKLGAVIQHYRKRPGDIAARYEGGRFMVLLYACGERHGRTIAERLRQDIESLNLMNPASPAGWTVTVSVGVHTLIPTRNQSPASGLLATETLLFLAKNRGRNCVVSDRDAASGDGKAIQEKAPSADRTEILPRSQAARTA